VDFFNFIHIPWSPCGICTQDIASYVVLELEGCLMGLSYLNTRIYHIGNNLLRHGASFYVN